ncbi:MAG TPA: NAD-dependent epimerase/dehydratase family protein [Acidimicrobiales bacterium]|jgi:UDP-glucose 4-epimerase|nr:NAD-dependent epimerase/dehydratase family protein [Acidimicrobiales bacterium]
MGRRVLVTGLGSFWGGRVAQALEAEPDVDVIVGLDTREPTVELERTEYVRSDESYSILSRIVRATQVDTIVHTFLVVDSSQMSSRQINETNVIGTMNLFAAASQPESRVTDVVVKSSTLVYGSTFRDPVWFSEDSRRSALPRHRVEKSLLEVEGYVRDYAVDNPHVTVSMLRFSNVLGADIVTPITKVLELPVVPAVFGFDPRLQFVHEVDVVRAIMFVLDRRLAGIYNVAGDGLLPWSEVAAICAKPVVPLPPLGRRLYTAPLRRLGVDLPPELLDLLTYGRGADNRRLKQAGFDYRTTSAGAVRSFAEAARLRKVVGGDGRAAYRYERDVEQFFRHSPAVVRDQSS